MIVMSQSKSITQLKSKILKCPKCNHGRLCDIPNPQNTSVTLTQDANVDFIIKCPNCKTSIGITIK